MRNLIPLLIVPIALTAGLLPLRRPLLFAEDSFLRLSGEPELTWLKFTLDPLPEREPANVLLAHDGRIVRRVMVDDLGIASTFIEQSSAAADKVIADLIVGHSGIRINRSMVPPLATRMPLHLELSVKNKKVSGSFRGQWRKNSKSMDRVEAAGQVTGVVVDPREDSLNPTAVWPTYLGPHQNFSSGRFSQPIVDDLNQARLMWVSEYIGPTEAGSHRYGACVGVPSAAGGFSPLVAHGRVYQVRYQAAGEVYQKPHIEKALNGKQAEREQRRMKEVGWTMDDLADRWRILTDEELLCIDAATGRTLWKVRWPKEGLHYFAHKCSLTNWTGAIAGDAVFVLGGTGRLRSVDAHTGNVNWEISVPGLAEQMGEMKTKALEKQHFAAPTRNFCHALAVAGDLVLAPDGIGNCGIVGIEAATGNVRWHVAERLLPTQTAMPLVVKIPKDTTLTLAVGDGEVTAIDCANGEIAWKSDAVGWNACQAVLASDRLIAQAMKRVELEKEDERYPKENARQWAPDAAFTAPAPDHGQIGCWKVTKAGLEHLWTTPAEWGAARFTPVGTVLGEHLCFRGKFAYQIVDLADGKRLARSYLSVPARMDEGHLLAVPGYFIPHPDTQHGDNKFYLYPDEPSATVGPLWQPPHPRATTYQVPMSHAWADGRLFIRGADALYCYDLRKQPRH